MQTKVSELEKVAIKHALTENWEEAIASNLAILALEKTNLEAKIRLGRAYLQQRDFTKAKKLFKEVLKQDPINPIALKNMALATKKVNVSRNATVSSKHIMKEPGLTYEIVLTIIAPRMTADTIPYGSEFRLNIKAKSIEFYLNEKLAAQLQNSPLIATLVKAKKQAIPLEAFFLKGEAKEMHVLLRSGQPIFLSERQDIKPYMKKGLIEEPELETEAFDDDVEEE